MGNCPPETSASACAFTTTERALHGFTITSEDLSGVVNALTCYRLRFVELTAGDQSAPIGYLFSALMLVPVSKLTREKTYSRKRKSPTETAGLVCLAAQFAFAPSIE